MKDVSAGEVDLSRARLCVFRRSVGAPDGETAPPGVPVVVDGNQEAGRGVGGLGPKVLGKEQIVRVAKSRGVDIHGGAWGLDGDVFPLHGAERAGVWRGEMGCKRRNVKGERSSCIELAQGGHVDTDESSRERRLFGVPKIERWGAHVGQATDGEE